MARLQNHHFCLLVLQIEPPFSHRTGPGSTTFRHIHQNEAQSLYFQKTCVAIAAALCELRKWAVSMATDIYFAIFRNYAFFCIKSDLYITERQIRTHMKGNEVFFLFNKQICKLYNLHMSNLHKSSFFLTSMMKLCLSMSS